MKCKETPVEIIPFCCGETDEIKHKEFKRHTTVCKNCAGHYFKLRAALKYLRQHSPEIKTVQLTDEILK